MLKRSKNCCQRDTCIMAPAGEAIRKLPVIDFRGLDPSNPTTPEWDAARAKVVAALESHSSFEAIYDGVSPELCEELFGKAMPELFPLPAEVKGRNYSPIGHLNGYIGQMPGVAFESLRTEGPATVEGIQKFTTLLWPEGNPSFFNTVYACSKQMQELVQMVQRMVLQSLDWKNIMIFISNQKHLGFDCQSMVFLRIRRLWSACEPTRTPI